MHLVTVGDMQLVQLKVWLIIMRQEDKAKVCNVTVIPNEECVPKHTLLVMDMRFNTTTRKLCYRKDDRMMHLIYECLKVF